MTRRPAFARLQQFLAVLISPLIRLLDILYRSAYNPLYRSGTLAVGMLIVLFVTGLYLVFFYNVAAPYESIERIHGQLLLGRWIRAVHRYATDIAILAVGFHILQMMIQGRTWGPRVLAWISGVVLMFALMMSTWTGYVMVWDSHGQWLAQAGAEMAGTIPSFRHQIMRTFSGAEPLTGSFFFMNLFLHVAIPLVMIAGIWIHTARLRRPRWLPVPEVFITLIAVLILFSIGVPAPLLPEADLTALPGRMPVDVFSSFWLPLIAEYGPGRVAISMLAGSLALILVPWFWQPRSSDKKPSSVDAETCAGCMQCYKDCPFESISMVKRNDGTRRQYAVVDPDKCVSCGLCAGSCDDYNIGPPGRKGDDQLEWVGQFLDAHRIHQPALCIVMCSTNPGVLKTVNRITDAYPSVKTLSVACAGTIHAYAVQKLLDEISSVLVVSCPEENCHNRHGHELAVGRLLGRAGPHLSRDTDLSRVRVISASASESYLIEHHVRELLETQNSSITTSRKLEAGRSVKDYVRTSFAHTILLLGVAVLSMKDLGSHPPDGMFRIVLELPGQEVLSRRAWTQDELASSSSHMRLPQKVEKIQLNYTLRIVVDGDDVYDNTLIPRRDGRQVRFSHDRLLEPGVHSIQAFLETNGKERLLYDQNVQAHAGQVELFSFDARDEQD